MRAPDPAEARARFEMEWAREQRRRRGRGEKRKPGGEPCPAEPNRPLDLSGGAAAALEFDG